MDAQILKTNKGIMYDICTSIYLPIIFVHFADCHQNAILVVIMRSGRWYYKDRLGRTRGPMELI